MDDSTYFSVVFLAHGGVLCKLELAQSSQKEGGLQMEINSLQKYFMALQTAQQYFIL